MAFLEPKSLIRIATTLEALRALYERDLQARGVVIDLPAVVGEGEIFGTDDEAVTALISRIRSNQPTNLDRGFYVGGDDSAFRTPAPEEGQTTEIGVTPEGRFGPVLFGSNWGLNRGPEGAEESWTGSDSNWSPGIPASGDVLKQGSST